MPDSLTPKRGLGSPRLPETADVASLRGSSPSPLLAGSSRFPCLALFDALTLGLRAIAPGGLDLGHRAGVVGTFNRHRAGVSKRWIWRAEEAGPAPSQVERSRWGRVLRLCTIRKSE